MASSLFPSNPSPQSQPQSGGQPQNLLQKFQQFRQMMQGRDPQATLNALISSGRVSKDDVQRATQMAQEYASMLKGFFR